MDFTSESHLASREACLFNQVERSISLEDYAQYHGSLVVLVVQYRRKEMDSAAKWTPSSFEERNYYDRLFQLADGSSTGKLAGRLAVTFLGKSGLAISTLKQASSLLLGDLIIGIEVLQPR